MTSQNQHAEALMQRVDRAQQDCLRDQPDMAGYLLHLSIVNIVLGTLYTINDNMQFGIRRILAAMDPIAEKLSADSWMYVKRPLVSLAEQCCLKFKGPFEEQLLDTVIVFLDDVCACGIGTSVCAAQVDF